MSDIKKTHPRISWTFDEYTNSEIRRAADTGIYDIRGGGSKRKLPHFDDLLFLEKVGHQNEVVFFLSHHL